MQNGNLVHISEVAKGDRCDCNCMACGEELRAVKTDKSTHHFKHIKSTKKTCAHPSWLLMAKEMLETERKIYIPKVELTTDHRFPQNKGLIADGMFVDIDSVEIDEKYGALVVHSGGRVIDVYLDYHFADTNLSDSFTEYNDAIYDYYNPREVSALNICLDFSKGMLDKDEFKALLIGNTENRKWLYNHVNECYVEKLMDFAEEIGVLDDSISKQECPINSSSSNNLQDTISFKDDCLNANFCKATAHL
jgi:hypothetical protein